METVAREIKIEGVVQGVGFRPFVFRLATEYGIRGWVLNSSEGVTIWAEAPEETVLAFYRAVISKPPKLALIVDHRIAERQVQGFDHFFIQHSQAGDRRDVMISPDVAVCEDCYREIGDRQDRRYRYPFTNCTNCGPRFTIIMDIPYDRIKTTMRDFPMCPACAHEFEDPMNRRFHAQPNACPDCGPQVTLSDPDGHIYPGLGHEFLKAGRDPGGQGPGRLPPGLRRPQPGGGGELAPAQDPRVQALCGDVPRPACGRAVLPALVRGGRPPGESGPPDRDPGPASGRMTCRRRSPRESTPWA